MKMFMQEQLTSSYFWIKRK